MKSQSGLAAQRVEAVDMVRFRGHPLVASLHPTTIEITTEEHLTERGDCIIGVGAEKGCSELSEAVRRGLRTDGSAVEVLIRVGSLDYTVRAKGDSRLELSHPHDIVIRKSGFVSDRTLALWADASARDLPRKMVGLLKDPKAVGVMEIRVA